MWRRRMLKEMLTGPIFDIIAYDPNAVDKDGNPITEPICVGSLRYKKPKRQKDETLYKPIWEKLADTSYRTLEDFQDLIEGYAYSYNKGFDPATGQSLKTVRSFEYFKEIKDENEKVIRLVLRSDLGLPPKAIDEFAGSQSEQKNSAPAGDTRNNVVPNEEVMSLLMSKIFDEDFRRKIGLD
jgi:hypothetical protein